MVELFIGLGAQKAGTTWIYSSLSSSNEIFVSPIKEMHLFDEIFLPSSSWRKDYFIKLLLAELIKPKETSEPIMIHALSRRVDLSYQPEKYISYYQSINPHATKVCDITPAYSMLGPNAYRYIRKRIHPNPKYFFIMRNPIDRYWSHLRMQERRQKKIIAKNDFLNCLHLPEFFERGNYKHTLETLFSETKKINRYVDFIENFSDSTHRSLFFSFLGISPIKNIQYASPPVLSNISMRAQAYKAFKAIYHFVYDNFQKEIPKSWLRDMEMFDQ